jgi:putative phosphoesterase
MKLLIASDIHGCAHATEQLFRHFEHNRCNYLILLGDLLNHGPRNPIPLGYDPQSTAEQLNRYADKIIAVRGNCDSEVDQMLLNFPLMADYNNLLLDGRRWYITHGHLHSPDNLPPLQSGDLFCYGHYHQPLIEQRGKQLLFNPGSVTFPRGGHPASYAIYVNGRISINRLDDGALLSSYSLSMADRA